MQLLRKLFASKAARTVTVAVVLVAGILVAVDVTKSTPTYPINVVYSSAPGLFTGAAVDVLGVKVGTVTDVQNVGDTVHVTLAVNQGTHIPRTAFASLVAAQLLGSPDVDLNPGYTGGAYLASGATIPEQRTAVPVSTDEVLKELQHTLNALNPNAVGDLVTNLATDLDGQGGNLNKLIASAAGTVQLLAEKGDDLGQLNGTLGQLTGTLDTDTSNIEQLVEQYDTVSTTIAQHSGQLNDAITQLAGASTGLVDLLVPNLQPLEADVGTVTTAGRTLDRNLAAVDEVLQNGNNLFQGAERAYDPTYNWLDLNIQAAPGVSGAYMAGLIRDRLAGVCRRIVANHSTGLSAADIAALNECGNPDSGFFDPLLNDIPNILDALTGQSSGSHHAGVAHAARARPDRQRRAGRRLGGVDAGTPVQGAGRRPDDDHDDDGATLHHDHDQPLRPAQPRFGLHRRLVGPQQLERRQRRHLGVKRRTAVRRRVGRRPDGLAARRRRRLGHHDARHPRPT